MKEETRPDKDKVEPVIILLFIGMIFFTGMLFCAEKWFPADGQMFQVVAGLLTGFSGAFFMRVKPKQETPAQTITQGDDSTVNVKAATPAPAPSSPTI